MDILIVLCTIQVSKFSLMRLSAKKNTSSKDTIKNFTEDDGNSLIFYVYCLSMEVERSFV